MLNHINISMVILTTEANRIIILLKHLKKNNYIDCSNPAGLPIL